MTATGDHHPSQSVGWSERLAARLAQDDWPDTPADKQARALARDRYLWAHPERHARAPAHASRGPGTCANDADRPQPCGCPPDPAGLVEQWARRARMAAARAAAGQLLDELDRQALDPSPEQIDDR